MAIRSEEACAKSRCVARCASQRLRACDETETVKISLSGPTMGMKITNGDSDSKEKINYIFYVMPMSNVR